MPDLKPREAEVLIYQGDDLARLAELRQAAEVAQRRVERDEKSPRRTGDEVPSADAERAAFDAFVEEAAKRAVVVRLRAIGRKRFRELVAEHPPRTVKVKRFTEDGKEYEEDGSHPDDSMTDVNNETFPTALLTYVDEKDPSIRTIVEPEFPTKAALTRFLDDQITEGDFDTLWLTAFGANRGASGNPLDHRYSTGSRSSTET